MTVDHIRNKVSPVLRAWIPIRDNSIFAEPWRRFFAAMLDTVFLLSIHILFYLAKILYLPADYDVDGLVSVFSPIVCLGYVAIGWKCSATLGMRVFGAKIVRENGENIDFKTALLRLFGFFLACLPVKLGLLPIFYDPRRQGWHDRIASTLVVKSSVNPTKNELPKASHALPECKPPVLDFKVAWKGAWLALPLYVVLGIAMTWPTAAHLSSRLMGFGRDPYIFVWNYWWFKYAIDAHLSPLHTNMIFYPKDISLALHTMQWFNCFLAYPMQKWMNLIAVYNTLNILSVILSAFCGYWMIAAFVKKWVPALVAGVACGFAPYFSAHLMGHGNLVAAEFMYPCIACVYDLLVTQKARYAGWAGLWMFLSGLCDLQYLAFSFLAGVAIFAALWLYFERPDIAGMKRRFLLLAGSWLTAGILFLPIEISAVQAIAIGGQDRTNMSGYGSFRADLGDWLPNFKNIAHLEPENFRGVENVEKAVRPGIVLLILAIVGACAIPRERFKFWAFLILVFVILASGPYLTIFDRQLSLLSFLALGFPGCGFDLIWKTGALWAIAGPIVANPGAANASIQPIIVMPYSWLTHVLPLLQPFRVPARFGLLDLAFVAILAAHGLQFLIEKTGKSYGRIGRTGFAVAAFSALLADFWMAPFTSYAPVQTGYLKSIKHDGAVIELPCVGNETTAYCQTVHHNPLFRSFISREPKNAMSLVYKNTVLNGHVNTGSSQSYAADFEQLRSLGARYAVLHSFDRADPVDKMPGTALLYHDSEWKVYRLFPPKK